MIVYLYITKEWEQTYQHHTHGYNGTNKYSLKQKKLDTEKLHIVWFYLYKHDEGFKSAGKVLFLSLSTGYIKFAQFVKILWTVYIWNVYLPISVILQLKFDFSICIHIHVHRYYTYMVFLHIIHIYLFYMNIIRHL